MSSLNLNKKVTTSSNFAGAAIVLILFDLSATGLAQTSITQDTYSFAVLIITISASLILWRVCKSIKDIESLLAQKQVDDEQFRISFSRRLPNLIHRFLILSLFSFFVIYFLSGVSFFPAIAIALPFLVLALQCVL